jgi:hypothetical protein
MARPRKKEPEGGGDGEVKAKDFDRAKALYLTDIKPAASAAAEKMQEASTAFKEIKKGCHIQPSAMKEVIKVLGMEDAKREDYIRCRNGLEKAFGIDSNPKDMVDMMQGDDGYARPKPSLVAVPSGPTGDTDLAGDD